MADPVACSFVALTVILTVVGIVGSTALFMVSMELGRLPGWTARWHVVVRPYRDRYAGSYGDRGHIDVLLRKRGASVDIASVDPRQDDFDTQLHGAMSIARERLIALRVSERSARRSISA